MFGLIHTCGNRRAHTYVTTLALVRAWGIGQPLYVHIHVSVVIIVPHRIELAIINAQCAYTHILKY